MIKQPFRIFLLLAFLSLTMPVTGYAAFLPTEEEIKGIQNLCGAGNVQSVAVKGNVDAAIKNWKSASVSVDAEAAKKNLAGFMDKIKNDSNIAPVYKVYVDCVRDTLQQFIDREKAKPRPVGAVGKSTSLLRSAFSSDEEIRKFGCEEALANAKVALRDACPGRIVVSTSFCPQVSGSPRTYSLQIEAECFV